jgi:hypothetical protein
MATMHACCLTLHCVLCVALRSLPSYTTAVVNFTGTLPKVMRLYWPYAAPQAELVLVINSMGIPNRRFVYLDDKGRLDPLDAPPTIGDGTGHGAFYWSQSKAEMFVKMKGGAPLEIRQESAVAVSTSLALTVDQFYDTQVGQQLHQHSMSQLLTVASALPVDCKSNDVYSCMSPAGNLLVRPGICAGY